MNYTRKNPFIAKLKRTEVLTKPGSLKDTRHYEIDLKDSEMDFEPGDSLAIFPTNCSDLVEDVINALKLDGNTTVTSPNGEEKNLRDTLRDDCAITQPDKKFLNKIVEKAGDAAAPVQELLDVAKKKELADFLWGREIVDFLINYPDARFEAQEFVDILKKIPVRLYSIASSLKAYLEEVHLTVATVTYESLGRKRKGVCSTFLADRCGAETSIPCFITPGKGFRLPTPDVDVPVIMIGPGTGIAPFRAFMQERQVTQAKGKAWLFFGEQQQKTDYFYEEEWAAYMKNDYLHRLDVAFSRDQDFKIYVQHRMMEKAPEFWDWLEQGAIVYVCGDAARMANDVDQALHDIIAQQGHKNPDEAAAYVAQMKADKRYRRDVY